MSGLKPGPTAPELHLGEDAAGEALCEEFVGVGEELFEREFAGVDFGEEVALGSVLLVDNAGFGLQQAPGLAALDAEHDQLTR